jgi:NitT/TauT family transport system ATP-binding protein
MDVDDGEFIAIVGPSGCGKSTLLLMIAGLMPPTSGSITIGKTLITRPYTGLGMVFQDHVLLDWRDVLGNLMLQIEMRHLDTRQYLGRARELLSLVGLSEFEGARPFQLSGGMKQRVAICRALIHDPPLLLMDEPFGALDTLTRDQLNVDLQGLWMRSRPTVVFVTHSITEAVFLSDRVLVMTARPGRIAEELKIDLPRPRHLADRESEAFARHAGRIRRVFTELGVLREEA